MDVHGTSTGHPTLTDQACPTVLSNPPVQWTPTGHPTLTDQACPTVLSSPPVQWMSMGLPLDIPPSLTWLQCELPLVWLLHHHLWWSDFLASGSSCWQFPPQCYHHIAVFVSQSGGSCPCSWLNKEKSLAQLTGDVLHALLSVWFFSRPNGPMKQLSSL